LVAEIKYLIYGVLCRPAQPAAPLILADPEHAATVLVWTAEWRLRGPQDFP
jgi:hypothetical protein